MKESLSDKFNRQILISFEGSVNNMEKQIKIDNALRIKRDELYDKIFKHTLESLENTGLMRKSDNYVVREDVYKQASHIGKEFVTNWEGFRFNPDICEAIIFNAVTDVTTKILIKFKKSMQIYHSGNVCKKSAIYGQYNDTSGKYAGSGYDKEIARQSVFPPSKNNHHFKERFKSLQILNFKTGEIIYENAEAKNIKELVEMAVREKVSLAYANLEGADLKGANLMFSDLSYSNLDGVDFSKSDLSFATLESAFGKVNFGGATMLKTNIKYGNFNGSSFRNCYLRQANMKLTNLTKVDFYHADLEEIIIGGAIVEDADFDHAFNMDFIIFP